jgi:hypothetical protein
LVLANGHRKAATTLYFLAASNSSEVVVIRRGPSKWWHFLLWNRDTGVIEPGSWFHGNVYPERCDLSPKGDSMVLVAYRGSGDPIAWTALCTPPSVKAKVFWPQQNAKIGGGCFDGRMPVVWLNLTSAQGKSVQVREELSYEFGYWDGEQVLPGAVTERLSRDGWNKAKGEEVAWLKRYGKSGLELRVCYHGTLEELMENPDTFASPCLSYQVRTCKDSEFVELENVDWANWNSRGTLCFSRDAALYTADPSDLKGSESLIMNLNGLTPPSLARSNSSVAIRLVDL